MFREKAKGVPAEYSEARCERSTEAAREDARKQRKLQAKEVEMREPMWAYLSGMIDRRRPIMQIKHNLKSIER